MPPTQSSLTGQLTFTSDLDTVIWVEGDLAGGLYFNGILSAGTDKWGLIIDNLDWVGVYDAALTYTTDQVVLYSDGVNTSSYRAIDDVPLATPPPNSTYWTRVVKVPWRLVTTTRNNMVTIDGIDILHGHTYEVAVVSRRVTGEEQEVETSPRAQIALAGKVSTPSTPSLLAATPGIQTVLLTWTPPSDVDWDYTEVWVADSNNRATASLLAKVRGTGFTHVVGANGATRYYWIRGIDTSGNYSAWHPTGATSGVSATTGAVVASSVDDFAITATKMFLNTVVLSGDSWTDDSPGAGSIAWNQHTLVHNGTAYTITAGNTSSAYVYWVVGNSTYSVAATHPDVGNTGFVIATNISGVHTQVWNSATNMVIGSAYIANASITNAKIADLSADKINAGTLTGRTVQTATGASGDLKRAVLDSADNTFKLYDASGNVIVTIDDDAGGYVKTAGPLGAVTDANNKVTLYATGQVEAKSASVTGLVITQITGNTADAITVQSPNTTNVFARFNAYSGGVVEAIRLDADGDIAMCGTLYLYAGLGSATSIGLSCPSAGILNLNGAQVLTVSAGKAVDSAHADSADSATNATNATTATTAGSATTAGDAATLNGYDESDFAAWNHNHDLAYDAIGTAAALTYSDVGAAATSHNHAYSDITSGTPTLGNSAALDTGTAAGTVATGDHNHSGVYEPVLPAYDAGDAGKVLTVNGSGLLYWN